MEAYLRPREAAKLIGVSRTYIYLLIKLNKIKAIRKVGYLVISKREVNRILDSNKIT